MITVVCKLSLKKNHTRWIPRKNSLMLPLFNMQRIKRPIKILKYHLIETPAANMTTWIDIQSVRIEKSKQKSVNFFPPGVRVCVPSPKEA